MRTTESIIINGYDILAEQDRLQFDDVVVCGRRLNRGTAVVAEAGTAHPDHAEMKAEHRRQILPNTIEEHSPVIDYSYPATGIFVDSPAGPYLDLYQGVAQKLLDEQHPVYLRTMEVLMRNRLLFRREINTDDYVTLGDGIEGLHTSQELAALMNGLVRDRFGGKGEFLCFYSNSGAEAGEAAIKLAQVHAYRRLVARYGIETFERIAADLGIGRITFFDDGGEPCFADYPFFIFACESSFHGRTLGVLNMTRSKKVHHLGFGKMRWVRHIPFNGKPEDLGELIPRPITEILDAPGGVAGVIDSGRVPADLAALFAVECFQGEGGYRLADREWLRGLAGICNEHHILFGSDEVQTFGRTGRLFAAEHFGIEPDVLWVSKGAVVGLTTARADLAADCHLGWHSNTFGGGKFFDVNMAYTTIDLLTAYRDPVFDGRTYLENSHIKGEYTRTRLADLSTRHDELLPEFSGLGGMWGLTVRRRDEVVTTAWRMGAKMLGCGPRGDTARLRIILSADVLTREIDQMIEVLDRVFTSLEG